MIKPNWAYKEQYYMLYKNGFLFFLGFEHNWDLFDKFTNNKKYYFYLNDDHCTKYNFDMINNIYNNKLNHIDKSNIIFILKNESQKSFNIQFEYILLSDTIDYFKKYNLIINNIFFNKFNTYSLINIIDIIRNKYIPITDINMFVLYNDDCKILLTDDFQTGKNLINKFNSLNCNVIVINDEDSSKMDENIHHIKCKLHCSFPRYPISGCNNMINDYTDYCIQNGIILNNHDYDYLIESITSITEKIINNNLININEYIKYYLPFHILYNYSVVNDNIFTDGKIKSEYMPDYLYVSGMFIKGSFMFDNNHNYDEILANELSFWINIYDKNSDIRLLYDNNRLSYNIIEVTEDYLYVPLVHPHGWYCFGEYLDSIQKLYVIDKLKLDKQRVKLILHEHNRVVGFYDILRNLGYTNENFYHINNSITYYFKNCLYINQLCYPARMTKITKFWFINKQISQICPTINNKIRLYLNRNKYGNRNVINNDEILKLLEPYNFFILNGDEELNLIIRLFKDAEIIIGPHGSMFRNIIYCLKNPLIIEFCSKNRRDYAQFELALLSNIPYLHILSECDDMNNIIIDKHVITKYLAQFN